MRAIPVRYVLLTSILLASVGLQAQELTLFEDVETSPEAVIQPQPSFVMNQNGQPAFTMRGMMRVGDTYSVSLVNRDGQVKRLEWRAGERVAVPDLVGYEVVDVKPRSVVLIQPQTDPCIESPQLGVSCTGPMQALLTIATAAAPLPPTANAVPQYVQGTAAGYSNMPMGPQNPFEAAIQAQQGLVAVPGPGGQTVFMNPVNGQNQVIVDQGSMSPEMQAAREARLRTRGERLNQFQPQRIPDDQIPPGMRRVTTPFGDRLIPERE